MAITIAITVLSSFLNQIAVADLQGDLEAILADESLTGLAWTLVDETGEVSLGAAGLADSASGLSFTADRRFHVGSLTKSVVATAVLALATEERIDLDASAVRYLPGLSFDNPWAAISEVTVRHLLDHTSGLSDAHLWHLFSERADPDAPLAAAFPDPAVQLHIRARPGARFSYSNMGYTLLAMIIEAVVGQRYETFVDEQVLAPLGMRDSTLAFTTQQGDGADPLLVWGHIDNGSRYPASPVFLRPAGQFTTTAADLGRYAEFLLSDGVVAGRTLVDAALMRSRGKPSATEAAASGLVAGYALGMGRRDRHGVVGYCHGGNIVGFVAMFCVFPDAHKAYAYSVNTDSETADYARLDRVLIEALGVTDAPAPPTMDAATDISAWHGRYILSPNRFQIFEYLDTLFGAISISADGGVLTVASPLTDDRTLRPVGDRLYSVSDRTTTSHVFYRGNEGEYLLSDGFQTFRKVSAAYLGAHWASLLGGLVGLLWILIAGSISLIRWRSGMFRRPVAPAFIAAALLFVPLPLFFTQSFMALGDFTLASGSLAVATLLLPIGMLVTIWLSREAWRTSRLSLCHGVAAVLVLQWCAVLWVNGMLPLRLWG